MKNSAILSTQPDQAPRKARSMFVRMNLSMWVGFAIIAALALAAILAPQLSHYPPAKQNLFDQLSPPARPTSLELTNMAGIFGRDCFSVHATRFSSVFWPFCRP